MNLYDVLCHLGSSYCHQMSPDVTSVSGLNLTFKDPSLCQMPELSFAVGEEDVLVLEAEVESLEPGDLLRPSKWHMHQAQAEDAKDVELKNQRKVRMSRHMENNFGKGLMYYWQLLAIAL